MSQPKWRDPSGKGYTRPSTGDVLPGVTTIIKPLDPEVGGLIAWATNLTARTAVGFRSRWLDLSSADEAIDLIKIKSREEQAVKRDVGSAVHDAIEGVLRAQMAGEASPTPHPALEPYVAGMRRFQAETGWEPEQLEVTVLNTQLGYAGTLDAAGSAEGRRVMIDWKTGSIRPITMPAQLNLYQACDVRLMDDGSEEVWLPAERLWVVQLQPDSYAVHEVAVLPYHVVTALIVDLMELRELAAELPHVMRELPQPVRIDGRAI